MALQASEYEVKPGKKPTYRNVHVGADIVAIIQQSEKTGKWRIARLKTGVTAETHMGIYLAPLKDSAWAEIVDTSLDAAGLALRYWRSEGQAACNR